MQQGADAPGADYFTDVLGAPGVQDARLAVTSWPPVRRPARQPHELPDRPVLDPLGTPPVDRRHDLPVQEHREVQVVAAGQAGWPLRPSSRVHSTIWPTLTPIRTGGRTATGAHAVVDDHALP